MFYRQHSGCGQCVAVSQLGALYAVKTIQIAAQYNPDTWEGYHCWGPYNPPDTGWQTQDRPIVFSFGEFTGGGPDNRASGQRSAAPWDSTICSMIHVSSPMAKIPLAWARMWPLRSEYETAFRHHTAAELVELVRRLEGAAYPYHTYETLFADAQAQVLQLLQQIPGPEVRSQPSKIPGFSTLRPVIQCGPPALGNATGAVLAALGYTAAQRQQLFDAGVVAGSHEITQTVTLAPPCSPDSPTAPALVQRRGGPLAGVRVLDISGLGVGPVTGLFLAELGADVVKVEPPHGDLIRSCRANTVPVCCTSAPISASAASS